MHCTALRGAGSGAAPQNRWRRPGFRLLRHQSQPHKSFVYNYLSRYTLGDDFFNYFAVDVCEAEIPAQMTRGELKVVDAELVQDRGVEIVDVNFS